MKKRLRHCAVVLALTALASAATDRNWVSGTLTEMEQQKVPSGSTKTTNVDGSSKDKGDNTNYSGTATTHTTQDYDTYEVYTIQGDNKSYVARERLLFPWSKPANVTVGEKVKYSVQKNTLYILDDDGKEHKAGITKVKMKAASH